MNILFDLLIFSLPFGVISRINFYPNVYVYLHDIFAGIIFIVFVSRLLNRTIKIEHKDLMHYLLAFVGIGLVSLLVGSRFLSSQSLLVSFLYLVRYVVYGSLLFSIPSGPAFKKTLNVKLMVSGMLFALFGFLQYFYYPNLRNLYYAGWDEHLYRLFSTMLDPNFAGMFLVFVFLLFFANSLAHVEGKKSRSLVVFSFLSLVSLVAIYLTYSRSAFMALIAGIVSLLYVKKKTKIVLPILVLLILALFIFANTKIEGLNPFRTASSNARIRSVREGAYIFQRNPILGVGFNAYRYAQVRYGLRTIVVGKITNADAGTDNSYLFVLATTGIVGFIIFVRYMVELLRLLIRNISEKDILSIVALPSFLALLVGTVFLNSLFYPLIMTWMFILIGVTVNKKQ